MADHKCENSPCSAVSEFIGETKANVGHLKKDFEEIRLETKECLMDMRKAAEVIKSVEITLTAVAEITKQQNQRLEEGAHRFDSHERRMGTIEAQQKKISETMEGLPDKISAGIKSAFNQHHEQTHLPIKKRIKYLFWGVIGLYLFLLTTEHGHEMISYLRSGLFGKAGVESHFKIE